MKETRQCALLLRSVNIMVKGPQPLAAAGRDSRVDISNSPRAKINISRHEKRESTELRTCHFSSVCFLSHVCYVASLIIHFLMIMMALMKRSIPRRVAAKDHMPPHYLLIDSCHATGQSWEPHSPHITYFSFAVHDWEHKPQNIGDIKASFTRRRLYRFVTEKSWLGRQRCNPDFVG